MKRSRAGDRTDPAKLFGQPGRTPQVLAIVNDQAGTRRGGRSKRLTSEP